MAWPKRAGGSVPVGVARVQTSIGSCSRLYMCCQVSLSAEVDFPPKRSIFGQSGSYAMASDARPLGAGVGVPRAHKGIQPSQTHIHAPAFNTLPLASSPPNLTANPRYGS